MTTPESFWNFAVRTYRCEGIPEACLALQNERGADVNVLLFCCWVGATRGEFEIKTFDRMLEFSRAWADRVVRPLRNVRTWMKIEGCPDPAMPVESCMNLRERIKKVELEAERLQENVMQSMVDTIPGVTLSVAEQARAATLNLRRYCEAEGIDWDHETQTRLDVILRAAIPHGAGL
jgi:uncharacterized protein (TIGR02444 family)